MKYFFISFSLMLIQSAGNFQADAIYIDQKTFRFCTNVGPVELTFHGKNVTGWYILTVTPEKKKGSIKGIFNKGLVHADWKDPDGRGQIIFGFDPGLTQFIAIYNRGNDPSHWYNEWKGVNSANIHEQSADSRKNLYCE